MVAEKSGSLNPNWVCKLTLFFIAQGCVHIGDEALYQLVRRCSRLQLVNLHGCRNLQDDGIMELAENSPALRYFNNVISENVDATLGNVNRVLFNPNGRGVDCSGLEVSNFRDYSCFRKSQKYGF